MGEATPTPEVAARVIEDLTAVEVDPQKGERLYKAAIIRSKQGTTYRMLAKAHKTGKLDIVHYGCDLDAEGKPTTKWAIRRILEQAPERFDREVATIQKAIADSGEEVLHVWTHDLAGIPDIAAQGKSLEEWSRKVVAEILKT
jgi:hypothetical protein